MNPRTFRAKLKRAVKMTLQGATKKDIAEALGVTPSAISYWQKAHADLWDKLMRMEKDVVKQAFHKETAILRSVRKIAGTDTVFADPERYFALAQRADKIAEKRGEPLFDCNGETTLCQFYDQYYRPNSEAKEPAVEQYQIVLRQWKYFSGDPPLKNITSAMLGEFKRWLIELPGMKKYKKASVFTVRKKLNHIQGIIYKAGPPGHRNRDAAGIIEHIPWTRPPKTLGLMPKIVTPEQLSDCYKIACCMDRPRIPEMKPAAWWRLLLVLAYNTGLRRNNLLFMKMDYIDWKNRVVVVPAANYKSGRDHVSPLNEITMEHLQRNRTDREFVLPLPVRPGTFHAWFHQLQDLAGIPREEHFGLHNIRKTTATRLWEIAPQAAQLALGHAGSDVTIKHYVQGAGIVSKALDALPQPKGFGDPA